MIATLEYRSTMRECSDTYRKSGDPFLHSMADQLDAGIRTLELREKSYADLLDTILDFDDQQDPDKQ